MKRLALFTTKIPHHASRSGYEQLIKYVDADLVHQRLRKNPTNLFQWGVSGLLRKIACSKWYQWDGIVSEYKTLRLAQQYKEPLIAHFLYGDTAIGLLPYIKQWMQTKIVLTIHGCPGDLPEILQYPRMLQSVDQLILLGKNQQSFFIEHGLQENQLSYVPHGVDLEWFKPDRTLKQDSSFRILIAGNWRRDFKMYRRICQRLESIIDVKIDVLTKDFNHSYFEGLQNVTLYDRISDEALLRKYQAADLMLLAVQDAAANNVLLEAMATGLPVLSNDRGAIRDYLGDEAGLYYESPDEAVRMIDQLKQNRNRLDEVSEKVEKRAQHFGWLKIADRMNQIYQTL